MKTGRFLLALALLGFTTVAAAQKPHPAKKVYADVQSWPATVPGQVELKDFQPFRAVYDRQYTQGSGPGAGEKRQDHVIVNVSEVGWDGRRAAAISVLDSGAARYSDTAMRSLTMIAGLDDLSILFEIGPLPGKAKDYYLGLVTDKEMLISKVMTEAQELQPQKFPAKDAGFGPGNWVMASMNLREGMKIRLDPYYSPQANPISQSSYGRVIGRKTMVDGSGQEREAWVVEMPAWYGPTSPKVLQVYLQPEPPYYLGTEIYNYDTDERKRFVWLRDLQLMKL